MKNSNMKERFRTIRTKANERKNKTLSAQKKEKLIPCSSCVNTKSTYLWENSTSALFNVKDVIFRTVRDTVSRLHFFLF